jgi:hypothetical protein
LCGTEHQGHKKGKKKSSPEEPHPRLVR